MGSEVNAADNVPGSSKLLFEALLDMLSCVLEVLELASDQQRRHILSDEQCVLLHISFHVAVFNIQGEWDVRADPVFRDACSCCFFFAVFGLFNLLLRLF